MRIFLGKPSKTIFNYAINKNIKSDDDMNERMDNIVKKLPDEKQQEIKEKQEQAKIEDPTLTDGCDDLVTIQVAEVAKFKGVDIQSVIGKEYPTTEDDNMALTKASI